MGTQTPLGFIGAGKLAGSVIRGLLRMKFCAPEQIIATRIEDGKVVRQRPICAYPAQAAYKGSGDINDAASFTCVTPDASSRPLTASDMILIQSSLRQRDMKLPNR